MDRYETRLRTDIASADESIIRLKAEFDALRVRKDTLEHALSVYAETKQQQAAQTGGLGREGSYSYQVLSLIRQSEPVNDFETPTVSI